MTECCVPMSFGCGGPSCGPARAAWGYVPVGFSGAATCCCPACVSSERPESADPVARLERSQRALEECLADIVEQIRQAKAKSVQPSAES